MKPLKFLWIIILSMGLLVPVSAQDSEDAEVTPEPTVYDCSTIAINRQVDAWYNTYIADRGEFEEAQAIAAAQILSDSLADLTNFCNTIEDAEPEEVVIQTGIGTVDAPFIIQAAGIVGDTTLDITQSILPANDDIIATGIGGADIIPEGLEYLLLRVTVSCRDGAPNGCRITPESFRVVGDEGILYAPTLSQIDDYFPSSRAVPAGTEREGVLPFLVGIDDTSLKLVYFPNGDALQSNALAYYFTAQGSPNAFEVTSTTSELLIRSRPVNGAPVGVLRSGQVATANGRNADGTWISIEAPEGTGWVSADFVASETDLSTLSVIEPEE
ncbi:MAG: hypothetical protein WBC91_01540 [Phototrophicaceae bacterium]